MKEHILKIDPEIFESVRLGKKTFEIRYNDRDYQVGDHLKLKETKYSGQQMKEGAELVWTGRERNVLVEYILKGPCYGLGDGWVIMSFIVLDWPLRIGNF